MISLLLQLNTAYANGSDADITILSPNFSAQGVLGIPMMENPQFGYVRYGVASSYLRDPLVLYEDGIDQGAIVARRLVNTVGIEFDLSPRFGAHLSLPVALQWSSEIPSLSRNGFGLGDLSAGFYSLLWEDDDFSIGSRINVYAPTHSNGGWFGEDSPRASVMTNGMAEWREVDLLAQTGFHFRSPVNTSRDFVLDNEWLFDLGIRWELWEDRYAIGGSYHSRHGLNNFFRGGAENTSEITTFVQQQKDNRFIQFGVAKGMAGGYGSSEFQLFINYSIHRPPTKPVEERIYVPPPQTVAVIEEPPLEEPEWEEEELAKVEEDQIIIREDIQFELGTDRILDASLPTLDFIAKLINEDVQIGHVVIEGHASEEGSHEYNYDLSNLRARAIFKALAELGVHPDRMSHRGYGEALPKNLGEDEASLAENRRVEFHIIRQDPPDTVLELRELRSAPWSLDKLKSLLPAPKVEEKSRINDYEEDIFEIPDSEPEESAPIPSEEGSQNAPSEETEIEQSTAPQSPSEGDP